jgi:glutaredoxin
MYGTRWCGYCKKARQYFEANGIAYADLDIEQSKVALAEFQAIGGRGVPVILVGSRRMNGFDAEGFRRLQKQAQDGS